MHSCDMKDATNELDTFQPIGLAAARVVSNLIKPCEISEMPDRTEVVSACGISRRRVCSKMDVVPTDHQTGDVTTSSVSINPLKPTDRPVVALVCVVLSARRFAQIRDGVIISPPINVIDKFGWPTTIAVEPRQTGGPMKHAINTNDNVTLLVLTSGLNSDQVIPVTDLAPENSRLRFIVEQVSQPLCCERIVELMRHLQHLERTEQKKVDRDGDTHAGRGDEKDSRGDGSNVTKRRAAGG